MKDLTDLEHARTGTSAFGTPSAGSASLCWGDAGRPPAPPELVIVDLVAQHDEEPHEELAGDGDLRFGAAAPMHEGEVGAFEIRVEAGRMSGGLAEDESEERTALLGDLAEPVFVGGGIERWG